MKYYIKERKNEKYCYTCEQWKFKNEFNKKNGRYVTPCRECLKKYYQENKKIIRLQAKKSYQEWYKIHGRIREDDYYEKYIKPWAKSHPEAIEARYKLRFDINKGYIKRPDKCEICNQNHRKISGHHFDYSKSLQVIWVCPSCHKNIHLNNLDKIKDINILKEKIGVKNEKDKI